MEVIFMARRRSRLDSDLDSMGDPLIAPKTSAVEIVDALYVNIREAPSVSSRSLKIVPKGTMLDKVSKEGRFYEVCFDGGSFGYIFEEFCKEV